MSELPPHTRMRLIEPASPAVRIWLVVAAMAATAAGLFLFVVPYLAAPAAPIRVPLPVMVLAFAAVEAFVRAAAIDLAGRYRVNVVSPVWVAESRVRAGLPPMPGIWAKDLAEYYVRLVEGDATGQVVEVVAGS